MSRWYFSVNSKAEGPITDDVLIQNLREGRLKPLDLVFREGGTSWCTVSEVPEFREAADLLVPAGVACPVTAKEASDIYAWVVLRKKGATFVQSGPFSQDQIIARIAAGELSYSDYVWRSGYKRWVRIGNLPEFDRRLRDRDGDPVNQIVPLPAEKDDEGDDSFAHTEIGTLGSIMRLDRNRHQSKSPGDLVAAAAEFGHNRFSEVRVSSLDSDDFTGSFVPQPLPGAPQSGLVPPEVAEKSLSEAQARIGIDDDDSLVEEVRQEALPPIIPEAGPKRSLRRSRIVLAGAVTFLVVVASLYVYDHVIKTEDSGPTREAASVRGSGGAPSQTQAQSAAQSPAQPARDSASVSPSAAQSVTSPEAAASGGEDPNLRPSGSEMKMESQPGVPTSQKGSGTAATTTAAVVEIVPLKLDESPQLVLQTNAPVGTKIIVNITGADANNGFRRSVGLARGPGEIPTVDLASWNLKPGEYLVEVTAGKAQASKRIYVGHQEPSERQALEKKTLIIVARRYEDLARSLGEGYAKSTRDVKSNGQTAVSNKWSVFFQDWLKTSELAGRSLNSLTDGVSTEIVYGSQINELKSLIGRLGERARQMNDAIAQSRGVASSLETADLVKEFARIREASTRLK
jgi:hypothetical protein